MNCDSYYANSFRRTGLKSDAVAVAAAAAAVDADEDGGGGGVVDDARVPRCLWPADSTKN